MDHIHVYLEGPIENNVLCLGHPERDLTSNFVNWIKTIMEQGLYFPYVSFGLTGPLHRVKYFAVTFF